MRISAISIPALLFMLTACDILPEDRTAEINKLPSPAVGGVNDTLKTQAEQAAAGGDYARAAQTYKQLVDKEPQNKDYTLAFADSLRRSGNHQAAVNLLNPYLAANPKDAVALETRGLCLMSLGSIVDAGKDFEAALAVDPTRWRTLNAVGVLFSMKNKINEAIAYFDESLVHNPENASALNNRGLALAMDGRYEEAVASFQRTKNNLRVGSPDMKQVDMNLALVYAIAGRLDEAERVASQYLSKAALYNNMAVYAQLSKNAELSRSYLDMALTQSPVYYERAWKNLGAIPDNPVMDNVTPKSVFLSKKTETEIKQKTVQRLKAAKAEKEADNKAQQNVGTKLTKPPQNLDAAIAEREAAALQAQPAAQSAPAATGTPEVEVTPEDLRKAAEELEKEQVLKPPSAPKE